MRRMQKQGRCAMLQVLAVETLPRVRFATRKHEKDMSRLPTSTLSPMRNPLDRSVEKRERRDAILLDRVSLATMYQRNLRKASTFETTVSFVPRVAMRSVQGCEETMSRCLDSNSHVPAYGSCNIYQCEHKKKLISYGHGPGHDLASMATSCF